MSIGNSQKNWEKVTTDPWVLQKVWGYCLELMTAPLQSFCFRAGAFARKAKVTYGGEDKSLLEKGAIERVSVP